MFYESFRLAMLAKTKNCQYNYIALVYWKPSKQPFQYMLFFNDVISLKGLYKIINTLTEGSLS